MQKPRTRKAMVEYLKDHFRYYTMSSINLSHSYAKKVKISTLGLTREEQDACYDMLEVEDSWYDSGYNQILKEFDLRHSNSYQIGQNGRSGGYLVLYQGGQKPSEYKSYCQKCGQKNYEAVLQEVAPQAGDPGKPGKCGRCGAMARYNATFAPETFTYPGKGMDEGEDFQEWATYDLRSRVNLVWDFDQTCDKAVRAYVKYAMENKVEEETVMVPKKFKVAVERGDG